MKRENLTNKKFGRLTAIKHCIIKDRSYWLCKCDCGKSKTIYLGSLKKGISKSCGCLNKELAAERQRKHGMYKTKFYGIWLNMKNRCLNKKDYRYNTWGGRGIAVCDKWLDFQGFYDDMYQSYQQHIKENDYTSIDRIDNDGNYCKENCRWATLKEQNNNKRTNKLITYNNKTMSVKEWSNKLNINYATLYQRIYKLNWSVKKALNKNLFTNQYHFLKQ